MQSLKHGRLSRLVILLIVIQSGYIGCFPYGDADCIPDERVSYVERDELFLRRKFAPAYCLQPEDQNGMLICLYIHKFNCFSGNSYSATVCIEMDSTRQDNRVLVDSLMVFADDRSKPKLLISKRGEPEAGTFQWHQLDHVDISSRRDSIFTSLYLSVIDSEGEVTRLAEMKKWLLRSTEAVTGVETFYTGHLRPRSKIDAP